MFILILFNIVYSTNISSTTNVYWPFRLSEGQRLQFPDIRRQCACGVTSATVCRREHRKSINKLYWYPKQGGEVPWVQEWRRCYGGAGISGLHATPATASPVCRDIWVEFDHGVRVREQWSSQAGSKSATVGKSKESSSPGFSESKKAWETGSFLSLQGTGNR